VSVTPEKMKRLVLTEDQEDRLKLYLSDILYRMEGERQPFIRDMIEELEAYEAPPRPTKTHPWKGASNLTVPVIGSMVDTIFPRIHATVFSPSTYVSVEEWPEDLSEHAKAWQDMLQWIFEHELNIARVADSWFMETIIHGTGVVKLTWERVERERRKYDGEGNVVKKQVEVIKNRPCLTHIGTQDLLIPLTAMTIQEAEIVAHELHPTWGQLKLGEYNGLYTNVDNVTNTPEVSSDTYTMRREEMENRVPSIVDKIEDVFECWMDFDLDGKGLQEPLLVTYHLPSRTLLRVQTNPYNHGRKPFREIVYFPRHNRFYGVGLARQLLAIQDEISTLHNQRIDNSTIGNTRMWKVVAGSRADQSFQGAAPGLKILVDSLDEFDSIQMGDVGASVVEGERIAVQYAQQRSGVSDFVSGIDAGGSDRQTATQFTSRLQQALTRFNWTLEQVRDAVADLAGMTTDLYEQFGKDEMDKFEMVLGERADLVREFLNLNLEATPTLSAALSLQVTASSSSVNRAVEQQNLLGLMQIIQKSFTDYEMPLIQMVINPQVPPQLKEYALERIEGYRGLNRRILEINDVRNANEIMGETEGLKELVGSVGGGSPAPEEAAGFGGLGGFGAPVPGPMGVGP
jgi:hypothetical protein